jgi:hypothetical protein
MGSIKFVEIAADQENTSRSPAWSRLPRIQQDSFLLLPPRTRLSGTNLPKVSIRRRLGRVHRQAKLDHGRGGVFALFVDCSEGIAFNLERV